MKNLVKISGAVVTLIIIILLAPILWFIVTALGISLINGLIIYAVIILIKIGIKDTNNGLKNRNN